MCQHPINLKAYHMASCMFALMSSYTNCCVNVLCGMCGHVLTMYTYVHSLTNMSLVS